MQWFQIKEQAVGEKRLILSLWLYRIFGVLSLRIIALSMTFITFIFSKSVKDYSKKYFITLGEQIKLKPTPFNQFRHILSYANSLVDKFLVCNGDFKVKNIKFENEEKKQELFNDIHKNKGVFFICNHIGNIEVMQALFFNKKTCPDFDINIFLSHKQSQVFNRFLNKIKVDLPLKIFPLEEMGLTTGVELKENLDKGDVVYIAGDRLSENLSKTLEAELFGKKIYLPKGTFKLAKLMDVPTYYISAIKKGQKYTLYLEKAFDEKSNIKEPEIIKGFTKFMEKMILIDPFQFYHFFDFFG